jgi:small conductance mechanosensitive channel
MLERTIPRLMRAFVLRVAATTVDASESAKRTETLTGVAKGASKVLIAIIAGMMILSELSVPIAPILGGMGIAGIAVGFGAQWLIRDLINGIFILAENQYRQGDVVTIAGVTGRVESINLRRTTLRDLDGKVHVVPNGEITVASNYTKHWSNIHLEIGVAYKEDMQHVFDVINDIGESIANDPYFGEMIIETPKVLRLDSFDDSAITIKVLGVCKPLTQWEIKGEMNRRIKKRFDEEGIEIPFPHQTVYWGYGAHPGKGNQGTEWVEPGEREEEAPEPDPEGVPPAFRSFGLATGKPLAGIASGSNGDGASGSGLTEAQRRSARDLKRVAPDEDGDE